jgi:hypothetical protein
MTHFQKENYYSTASDSGGFAVPGVHGTKESWDNFFVIFPEGFWPAT